jgi:hypothetical protein
MRIRARHLRTAWAAAFFVLLGLAGTFPASAHHTPKHQPGPPDAPPGFSKPQSGVTYTGRAYAAFVNVPTAESSAALAPEGHLNYIDHNTGGTL